MILVIALVMTGLRGGNAAFFSSRLIMSLTFIVRNKENRRRNVLSLIVIDTLIISQYFGLENLKDRLVNTHLMDSVKVDHVPVEIIQKANEIRGQVIMDGLPLAMKNPIVQRHVMRLIRNTPMNPYAYILTMRIIIFYRIRCNW